MSSWPTQYQIDAEYFMQTSHKVENTCKKSYKVTNVENTCEKSYKVR